MRVLLCHERFLFRYGVDRVLIMLGKGLRERGHTVSIMANRFDREVVETFASRVIQVPTGADDYLNLNEYTADWVERTWNQHFSSDTAPDIVVVAGWPFFASIPFFRKAAGSVVFLDCGAVPLEGFSGGALVIQEKLRRLRKQYLREASLLVGISDFIVRSQSVVDSDDLVDSRTILLGADHMETAIWSTQYLDSQSSQGKGVRLLHSLMREGRKTLLSLGRWEPGCYKNSEAAFDIISRVRNVFPESAMLVLAEPGETALPPELKDTVFPIGFPDDGELLEIMKRINLGLSLSLWEGFNLPLAEMQWLDRPALAFDVAAHPEVILHPWYLCRDNDEMAAKACEILGGGGPGPEMRAAALKRFRMQFTWDRAVDEYVDAFEKVLSTPDVLLIVDVTNSTRDPANSGVIRVTRRLCRQLQSRTDPLFVVWEEEESRYVLPTLQEFQMLGQFNGPRLTDGARVSPEGHRASLTEFLGGIKGRPAWLLLTETINEAHGRDIRHYARKMGLHIGAIFYDAIAVLRPELCSEAVVRNHGNYMRGLAQCDVVVPISNFSAGCLEDFWKREDVTGCPLVADVLPGEFGGYPRSKVAQQDLSGEIRILCVSTLEPRKNHIGLIRAVLLMQEKHPELDWSLTLVGNRYAGAFEIADAVEAIAAENPRIRWLGIVDDETLHRLCEEATFTVYASTVEGFGMPVMESIWHGRPCVCHREGVMAEHATGGGCLTADVTDAEAFSDAIYRLATDRELLRCLAEEAAGRKIKTWDDYAAEFLSIIRRHTKAEPLVLAPTRAERRIQTGWQDVIYHGCLCDNWQMNDSERLALTGILSRVKPRCSIEVGTFEGGSLSLISQYSGMVFSIDIDPRVPHRFSRFRNVSFLTGPSADILPLLLKELDTAGIPPEFILLDGNHSAGGIKADLNAVLSYAPKKPLVVMMHDSFNPECRRGMLEADWNKSPHVDWVDIDFVPGRIVEHGGGGDGEMWGGLGMAYLVSSRREVPLSINRSAEAMFSKVWASLNGGPT